MAVHVAVRPSLLFAMPSAAGHRKARVRPLGMRNPQQIGYVRPQRRATFASFKNVFDEDASVATAVLLN